MKAPLSYDIAASSHNAIYVVQSVLEMFVSTLQEAIKLFKDVKNVWVLGTFGMVWL